MKYGNNQSNSKGESDTKDINNNDFCQIVLQI